MTISLSHTIASHRQICLVPPAKTRRQNPQTPPIKAIFHLDQDQSALSFALKNEKIILLSVSTPLRATLRQLTNKIKNLTTRV
ncbi:MAG: hypothetical protein A2W80_11095 [Candidatus Riflebacteria bacterium GWC2_50_8]|nr:MAG: hypothetical protein A2W80_11095 [Candidatus Riflebacteria bacterium GWC2_50_8]